MKILLVLTLTLARVASAMSGSDAPLVGKLPVHAFVGALDKTVPTERSERMIDAIEKVGGREARLKVYPEEGCGAGRKAVVDQEFYAWLFSHHRGETLTKLAVTQSDVGPQAEIHVKVAVAENHN